MWVVPVVFVAVLVIALVAGWIYQVKTVPKGYNREKGRKDKDSTHFDINDLPSSKHKQTDIAPNDVTQHDDYISEASEEAEELPRDEQDAKAAQTKRQVNKK